MSIDMSHTYTVEVGYDEFCGALAARDLKPLWKIAKQLMPEVHFPPHRPGSGSGMTFCRWRSGLEN